jgi:hypothetical protein
VGWGLVCPGGYVDFSQGWLWESHVPLICSPVGLPSRLGAGAWQRGSPPGFSIYHDVGELCADWGCRDVEVLPLLVVFPVQCVSSISEKFLL